MPANIGARLSTEPTFIKDIVADIKKGEVKIPKFQRSFVWRAQQALSLLDSIANGYPIGSLLLWKTNDKLASERNIGDFRLPETDDITPTSYVLDGQQRLTVIYSCFGAGVTDEGFAASFDLQSDSFIESPKDAAVHLFPLRYIFETSRLLDFRTALGTHSSKEILQGRLDSLIDTITGYKIPVVTLKELSVDEVCPIFERINSSGTRLSTYDLMVAATWSEEFDLNDEAEIISSSLEPKGFSDIDGDTILKCISSIHNRSIKKEDILALRSLPKSEMDDVTEKTREALLKSVDLLSTEFGIYSWDFLPYEAFIIVLCNIFESVSSLSSDQVNRLRQWFWRSAFAQHYRGASEHFVSRDIQTVSDFVLKGNGNASGYGSIPTVDIITKTAFRSNNSRSRAFILSLARYSPRNLTNGAVIDVSEALSAYNKKQFHHIFPKAFLKRTGASGEHNSLANICMLAASENRAISDENPNTYLAECTARLGKDAAAVFASNIMPRPELFEYETAEYPKFLAARAQLIHERVLALCDVGNSSEAG